MAGDRLELPSQARPVLCCWEEGLNCAPPWGPGQPSLSASTGVGGFSGQAEGHPGVTALCQPPRPPVTGLPQGRRHSRKWRVGAMGSRLGGGWALLAWPRVLSRHPAPAQSPTAAPPSGRAPASLCPSRHTGRAQAPGRTVARRLGAGDAQGDMSRQARLTPDSCTRAACVRRAHRPCLRRNTSPGGAGQTSSPRRGDRGTWAACACGLCLRAAEPSGPSAKAPAARGVCTAALEPAAPRLRLLLS